MSKSANRPDSDNQQAAKTTVSSGAGDKSNNKTQSSTRKQFADKTNSSKKPFSANVLSTIALLITVATASGLYLHVDKLASQKQSQIDDLKNQLSTFKQQLAHQQKAPANTSSGITLSQMQQQLEQQRENLETTQAALTDKQQQIDKLHEKLQALTPGDNSWLIAQANYLVTLAARKIWSDEDFTTAQLLLKSADRALADTQDPSLLPIRQALSNDIASLAKIIQIDSDGIRIQLMQLANQVTELPLMQNYQELERSEINQDDTVTDTKPSKAQVWWQRFSDSSKQFLQKFIHVEKQDSYANCVAQAKSEQQALDRCQLYKAITMPDQALYLRENIRLQLLIAAQSVAQHQQAIYLQAMQNAYNWSYAYFDTMQPATKAYLDALKELSETNIQPDNIPQQLQAAPLLEKTLQTRVRNTLSQP